MSRSYEASAAMRRAAWSPEGKAFASKASKYFANERRNATNQLAREYVGGGLSVALVFEGDIYSVIVHHPEHQYPITHAEAPRERPARRLFGEVVAELTEQFEAQGWRWTA
ncbi:hypothetical protein SAMN04489743_2827 [Pseudarthrobacter equi]|uniref:Uncharacterized protein n=1 Tax=Pseudarthrobacter equi TaxID=728066 RepID=A0A1H2A7S6_9MICC|nr:hypothetical protein [Pseudarthrobacter equi]SDT41832.1 hypothetical protein SAMN04489743_2827 [Pseudarthrobacter equi]